MNFLDRVLLGIIIFVSVVGSTSAQTQDINFKHISYKEGLVQSPISNFLQDDKGFIWFGNLKSLTRYDGYEFKKFVHSDSDGYSLSNNKVNYIYQDSYKKIWIATYNGLNLYNPDKENFQSIDVREVKGGRNFISSIVEDHNRNLWVGTFSGIKRLNKRTLKLEDVFSDRSDNSLNSLAIFSLFADSENNIWAGTSQGLKRFNSRSLQLLPLPHVFQSISSFSKAKVLVIKQDKDGEYWYGTETSGVFSFQPSNNKFISYKSSYTNGDGLASNWVKDILVYDAFSIWFATQNGITVLDKRTGRFSSYRRNSLNPNSLSDNAIWCFMKDKTSCVWIGTYSGGINFYYKGNSNFLNITENPGQKISLDHPLVNAVSEDTDGSLWIGTYGGGLNYINRYTRVTRHYSVTTPLQERASNGVKSLADDKLGNLWIGLLDGLIRFNKKRGSSEYFSFPSKEGKLSERLINAVLPDGKGVWIGTNGGGLRYFEPGGENIVFQRSNAKNSISDNFVTTFARETNGDLWVGTQNGLNFYNNATHRFEKTYKRNKNKRKNRETQISNNNVRSLFIDSKHRLWVGTEGAGLNYFDRKTEKFYAINKALGLPDDVINAIVEDRQQNLWVSTDFGLVKLSFKTFQLPFKKENLLLSCYSANDGLASNQFSHNTGVLLKSGELAFGGLNGLSIFYPDKIVRNNLAPPVVLTDLQINTRPVSIDSSGSPLKRSISQTKKISLKYDEAYISIKFAALNYINPENNQYAYRLEGFNHSVAWQNIGNQRVVTFANLQPGTYFFKVKASNSDNIWNKEPGVLKITILPPWWRTWWAYLIYLLAACSIAYIIFNFLRHREILKRDLYLEHLQNERSKELYQMKLDFFTNISHEIRTPLTLILAPLEKMINTFRDNQTIWTQLIGVKNNADRLMRLVTELLDFRKAETGNMRLFVARENIVAFSEEVFFSFQNLALSKNIDYDFDADPREIDIYFDRNQLEKVLYNLLSNAFKFTHKDGVIRFSVKEKAFKGQMGVLIRIFDNGKGISEENQAKLFNNYFQVLDQQSYNRGFGIGLALSKSIIELHHGKIEVTSKAETNNSSGRTVFRVFLPYGKKHFTDAELQQSQLSSADSVNYHKQSQVIHLVEGQSPALLNRKYSLLIVEDNDEVRMFLKDSLQQLYQVYEASNGEAGVEIATEHIPDLIISDVMMPVMDGLELCRLLKTDERTNHIPIILLTAQGTYIHQINGLETGADAYIPKPFSIQILELNVRNILASKEAIRKKFSQQVTLLPQNLEVASPDEKFLGKLMQIIEDKMEDSEYGVMDLADDIGMSKTVLYKKVKALTNYSIADLIKSIRLKKAAMLLAQNKLSIAEVAFAVGFNDRKYFSKEFRKEFGKAPSAFIDNLSEAKEQVGN